MKFKVVYFGSDGLHRRDVLRRAGFVINHCPSLIDLVGAMKDEPDVVVIGEIDIDRVPCATAIVRGLSRVPMVYFESGIEEAPNDIDLTIDLCTPPIRWLAEIERLINHSRAKSTTVWSGVSSPRSSMRYSRSAVQTAVSFKASDFGKGAMTS
jgi:hypothetical protein